VWIATAASIYAFAKWRADSALAAANSKLSLDDARFITGVEMAGFSIAMAAFCPRREND